MAGLIMAGIGQGIANAGNAIGSIGVRDYETREAARLRRVDREEDRAWREEQKEIDRDRQDERDRMYRRTAEQQAAGGKGGGMKGFASEDIAPGGKLADMIAGQMGMTVPEYAQFYNARKTGDMSAYATESKDIGKVLDNEYGEQTLTERVVPEGFKKEFAAKSKMLSDIQQSYVAGSEAKNIAEGRQIGLVTNAMADVQAGNLTPTKAAQISAISKGTAPYGGDSNVTRNVLEGDTTLTGVGTATVAEKGALAAQATAGAAENTAQAATQTKLGAKYDKEILKIGEEIKEIKEKTAEAAARTGKIKAETGQVGKDGGKDTDKTQERLSSVVNATNATIRSLEETKPPASSPARAAWDTQYADALALRAEATRLQKEALGARAAPPPPPPAAAAAAKGDAPKKVTKAEYDALPSGARYIDPTGQVRTKK